MKPAKISAGIILLGIPVAAITLLARLQPSIDGEGEITTASAAPEPTAQEIQGDRTSGNSLVLSSKGDELTHPQLNPDSDTIAEPNDQEPASDTATTSDKPSTTADSLVSSPDEFNHYLLDNPYTPYSQLNHVIDALTKDATLREDWLANLLDNPDAIPPQTDYVLSRLPASELDGFLSGALNSDDDHLQRVALTTMRMHPNTSLAGSGLEQSIYNIIQGDYSVSTTRAAIDILGEQGAKEAELKSNQNVKDNLLLALRSESTTIRHASITALSKLFEDRPSQHHDVHNAIVNELSHSDESVRELATLKLDVWLDYLDVSDRITDAVVRHLALSTINEDHNNFERRMQEINTVLSYLPLSSAQANELAVLGYL